jgi:hypothetical protein
MRTSALPAAALPLRHDAAALPLDDHAVAEFSDRLHAIHPDAPRVDAARLAGLAQWLLGLDEAQSRRELQQRLARLRELRRMASDRAWDTEPEHRARLATLLVYVSELREPGTGRPTRLGRLDEALMVELAWPAFADEVEDYLDFCRFRHEQHPLGAAPLTRSAWHRLRVRNGLLWQRMRQEPVRYDA